MYSGSDSNESQKYTQWPLSASAGNAGYAPATGEQVDWAALAQQWIIMKEAGPPPPVPGEQPVLIDNKKEKGQDGCEEGGEAPMDVEGERGADSAWQSAAAAANWQWPPTVSAQGAWAGAWDNASAWGPRRQLRHLQHLTSPLLGHHCCQHLMPQLLLGGTIVAQHPIQQVPLMVAALLVITGQPILLLQALSISDLITNVIARLMYQSRPQPLFHQPC
nr:unnamed protein product [Callosobruchus chinensis]